MDALIIDHYGKKVGTLINRDAQTAMADSAERLRDHRTGFHSNSTTYVLIFFLLQMILSCRECQPADYKRCSRYEIHFLAVYWTITLRAMLKVSVYRQEKICFEII